MRFSRATDADDRVRSSEMRAAASSSSEPPIGFPRSTGPPGIISRTPGRIASASLHLASVLRRTKRLDDMGEAVLDALGASVIERTAVLLFESDGKLHFKAWRGISETFRRDIESRPAWPWASGSRGVEPLVVRDVANDPALE